MMERWKPLVVAVFVCALLGGLTPWVSGRPEDTADLAIGSGFLGLFPGTAWALLERKLAIVPGGVASARRKLWLRCGAGFLVFGGLGGGLLVGGASLFRQGLQATGFSPPLTDLPRLAAHGFLYGGLAGLLLGFSWTFLSSVKKP